MAQFYDISGRHATWEEIFWETKNPIALALIFLIRLFRIPLPFSSDDPTVDSTIPFVSAGLPDHVAAKFNALLQEIGPMGFVEPVCHTFVDAGTQTTIYWATLRHESGKHFVRLHHRIWQKSPKPDRGTFVVFFTEFADGTFLGSSNGKPDVLSPKTIEMNRMRGATVADLWAAHTAKVGARQDIVSVNSAPELLAAVERQHVLTRDFHLQRKFFRPRSAADSAKAQEDHSRIAAAEARGLEHPGVIAEIEKIQSHTAGWAGRLWLLVLSVVLFIAFRKSSQGLKITLALIPILLFHEGGHWVAMKLCRYRNLRMFFIPFFGAAVTGQQWNVPGWKKAIVSLAGPVPGILVGVVLGCMFLATRTPWMATGSLLLLILNGLNLLPFLPLDGGQVLHAVLFCRNRWLDLVFRLFAILGVFLLGMLAGGPFTIGLAVILILGLPVAFKLAKIATDFKSQPLPPPMPDDRLPVAALQPIITAVKAAFPQNLNDKLAAQHTLNVYESVNARPPGALATTALLTVHAGSFLLALVFAIVLVVGRSSSLMDFAENAAHRPDNRVTCGTVQTTGQVTATNRDLVIVTAVKAHAASNAFALWGPEVKPGHSLTLFGDSLILTLPADQEARADEWLKRFNDLAPNAFKAGSNMPVIINMYFIAPDSVATNLQAELDAYFNLPSREGMVPPWSPKARGPEYARAQKARLAWNKIVAADEQVSEDESVQKLSRSIGDALKRGDRRQLNNLGEKQDATTDAARKAIMDRLVNDPKSGVTRELLALHDQWVEASETNEEAQLVLETQINRQMGALEGGAAAVHDGVQYGACIRSGLLIRLSGLMMDDPAVCLPELLQWLCDQKCIDIRYDITELFGGK